MSSSIFFKSWIFSQGLCVQKVRMKNLSSLSWCVLDECCIFPQKVRGIPWVCKRSQVTPKTSSEQIQIASSVQQSFLLSLDRSFGCYLECNQISMCWETDIKALLLCRAAALTTSRSPFRSCQDKEPQSQSWHHNLIRSFSMNVFSGPPQHRAVPFHVSVQLPKLNHDPVAINRAHSNSNQSFWHVNPFYCSSEEKPLPSNKKHVRRTPHRSCRDIWDHRTHGMSPQNRGRNYVLHCTQIQFRAVHLQSVGQGSTVLLDNS